MQRKIQHVTLPLRLHPGEANLDADAARRRLRWYVLGLVFLAFFLMSLGLSGGW